MWGFLPSVGNVNCYTPSVHKLLDHFGITKQGLSPCHSFPMCGLFREKCCNTFNIIGTYYDWIQTCAYVGDLTPLLCIPCACCDALRLNDLPPTCFSFHSLQYIVVALNLSPGSRALTTFFPSCDDAIIHDFSIP